MSRIPADFFITTNRVNHRAGYGRDAGDHLTLAASHQWLAHVDANAKETAA